MQTFRGLAGRLARGLDLSIRRHRLAAARACVVWLGLLIQVTALSLNAAVLARPFFSGGSV